MAPMMTYHQVFNVMHKNFILKRRSKASTCCELLVPLLVVGMLILGYKLSSTTDFVANNYVDIQTWPEGGLIQTNSSTTASLLRTLLVNATLASLLSPSQLTPAALADIFQPMGGSSQRRTAPSSHRTASSARRANLSDVSRATGVPTGTIPQLAGNTTDLQTLQQALCDTMGLCFTFSTGLSTSSLDASLDSQEAQALLDALNNPIPVIPFDLFVLMQKYIETRVSDYIRRVAVLIPWINTVIQRRKLAFAPDTPEVRAMVAHLNATTFFFGETFYGIFPTEADGVEWARTEGQDKLWALIVFNQLDVAQRRLSYVIRMNQSATPSTTSTVLTFTRGRSDDYQQYILSGFPSLQHMVEGYFLESQLSSSRPLGASCPATVPGIDFEVDPDVTLNSTSGTGMADALLAAFVAALPRDVTDLVPGLVDSVTGEVNPAALGPLRRLLLNPVNAVSLVLPVPDYTGSDFFSFASVFIGMVGVYAYLFPLAVTIRMMTQEKETRIKQGMLIMGLQPLCLFLSWLLTNGLTATGTALLITAEMKGGFCKYSDVTLIFVLQWLFALSTVTFALLCSTLFNRARNAAIVGPLLLFVATIPTLALPDDTPIMVKALLSLLSPCAYSWGMAMVAVFENLQVPMTWNDITQADDGGYTVALGIVMLMVDTFLYLALAWYLDQTLPSAFGVRRSPCFCLPARFRRLFRRKNVAAEEEVMDSDTNPDLFEKPSPEMNQFAAVRITHLRKQFRALCRDTHVAVDGLSLTMYENQINVVLGHNGAGKTTTIHMMTGILPPTAGDCLIYGRSIRSQMNDIRGSLGLCPQHDTLWPKLSVAEHLRFYAKLKGMDRVDIEDAVRTTMYDIGLTDKADAWSCTLSGGMKRRLSVGIALIGGSKVVFLDEPTSGMDPLARRHTWDLLRRAKQGRVLVLTTHFMDEADLLADSIAIMSKGRLRCHGSPLFLKSRLGVGYNLSFDLKEGADRGAIRHAILHHAPSASALSEVVGECQFKLPMVEAPNFPTMFRTLEDNSLPWGILSFGLSLTTIEEVFLRIARETAHLDDAPAPPRRLWWPKWGRTTAQPQMVQSVLRKPSPVTVTAPATFATATDTVSEEAGAAAGAGGGGAAAMALSGPQLVEPLDPSEGSDDLETVVPVGDDKSSHVSVLSGLLMKGTLRSDREVFFEQLWVTLQKRAEYASRDHKTMCLQILFPVAVILLALIVISIPSPSKPPLALDLAQYSNTQAPELLAKACGWAADSFYWSPDAAYDVREVNNSAELSNYSLKTFYRHVAKGPRVGGALYKDTVLWLKILGNTSNTGTNQRFGEIVWPVQATTILHNASAVHALPSTFAELNRARLRKRTQLTDTSLTTANYPFPLTDNQQKRYDAVITLVAALFVLIPFTFFPANCVAFIVKERELRAKHLQTLSGLRSPPYWLACYIFDNCSMLITTFLTLAMFALFKRSEIVGNFDQLSAAFLLFVLYGLSSIALGYLCSFAFNNHSSAQNALMIINFLFGFVLVLGSQVMNSLPAMADTNKKLEWIYRMLPAYCLGEGIFRLSVKSIWEINWGRKISAYDWAFLGRDMAYLSGTAGLWFLLVLYVDSALRIWVHRQVVHCFSAAFRWARRSLSCGFCCSYRKGKRGCCCDCCIDPDLLAEDQPAPTAEEDEDVLREREAVEVGQGREGDKVTVQRLRKTYPRKGNNPPKTAVHDLSFGVPNNEIFALLGSNGAGKTTTLSMMSGEFPPTSGRILLNGFDIQTQRRQAQATIGYCPQFDALLDYLSVEGHLRLYGRLRGLPKADLDRVVDDIVEYLGLGPHRRKSAMSLSGGNKRKLSIGIAIIGSPDVVFLDEPSSGLDPVSRRSLWTCISDLAANRSIILTTHHLEEVDALAHRVTIMLHGRLRCLGTLQHVKSKFGDGYRLQFRVPPSKQDELDFYLVSCWPTIILEEENFGRVVYNLPSVVGGAAVRMSEIFGAIQKAAPALEVEDYSVTQTSLQDVFLKFTTEEEQAGGRPRSPGPACRLLSESDSDSLSPNPLQQCASGDQLGSPEEQRRPSPTFGPVPPTSPLLSPLVGSPPPSPPGGEGPLKGAWLGI